MKKRYLTLLFFVTCDIIFSFLSLQISFLIVDVPSYEKIYNPILFTSLMLPVTIIFVFYVLKIYNILWRYSKYLESLKIIVATIISFVPSLSRSHNSRDRASAYTAPLSPQSCCGHPVSIYPS